MASRESLKKLKKDSLHRLATDLGLDCMKKKKDDIINEILNLNAPLQYEGGSLSSDPHFTQAKYVPLDTHLLPDLPFSAIVRFMVDRCIGQNQPTQNFRGLDRASKHYEAGDVRDIEMAMVSHSMCFDRNVTTIKTPVFSLAVSGSRYM